LGSWDNPPERRGFRGSRAGGRRENSASRKVNSKREVQERPGGSGRGFNLTHQIKKRVSGGYVRTDRKKRRTKKVGINPSVSGGFGREAMIPGELVHGVITKRIKKRGGTDTGKIKRRGKGENLIEQNSLLLNESKKKDQGNNPT